MQRIYSCGLTPEQYLETEAHRQIEPESVCACCGKAGALHGHGSYARNITGSAGRVLRIMVARFLCAVCGVSVSYLPDFALSYRIVQAPTVEAFLDDQHGRVDVQRWEGLLQGYRRRMKVFAAYLLRMVGCGLGRAPPSDGSLWPWLKKACGSLRDAARRLVADFGIGVFRRYRCHKQGVVCNHDQAG